MQKVTLDIETFEGTHYDYGVFVAHWMQQTKMLKIERKNGKNVFLASILMYKKRFMLSKILLLVYGMKSRAFKTL